MSKCGQPNCFNPDACTYPRCNDELKVVEFTQQEIWDVMKGSIHKNKKKYNRKNKHKHKDNDA